MIDFNYFLNRKYDAIQQQAAADATRADAAQAGVANEAQRIADQRMLEGQRIANEAYKTNILSRDVDSQSELRAAQTEAERDAGRNAADLLRGLIRGNPSNYRGGMPRRTP